MLTGSALLAKVKELGDASKSELVRACGYVSVKKDGSERLNFTAFYEALLEAKG
ncbi:MAG: AbrB family transcriptional regulator, partial [Cyanobium sp.]